MRDKKCEDRKAVLGLLANWRPDCNDTRAVESTPFGAQANHHWVGPRAGDLLKRQSQLMGDNPPNVRLHGVDRPICVDDMNPAIRSCGLGQNSLAQTPPIFRSLAFHSI